MEKTTNGPRNFRLQILRKVLPKEYGLILLHLVFILVLTGILTGMTHLFETIKKNYQDRKNRAGQSMEANDSKEEWFMSLVLMPNKAKFENQNLERFLK